MEKPSRRVPPDQRKRTETSCDKCKTRKQKCQRIQGEQTCRYCKINGIHCSSTHPRKQRIQGSFEAVSSRLALLESLVKGLVPEADISSNEEMQRLGKFLGIPLPPVHDTPATKAVSKATATEDETSLPLVPDQQGQSQFIGPASSFSFHLNLRRLLGSPSATEFAMFGRNAAEETDIPGYGRTPSAALSHDGGLLSDVVRETDRSVLDSLVDAYFEFIHLDFPILHEATFREAYEAWSNSRPHSVDPSWFCILLGVLILSYKVDSVVVTDGADVRWWRILQALLPTVFFNSKASSVQALLLAALHLHNTSHRDACWNLTGTATRIAVAIGLHRDDIKHTQSPLNRELRKQIWWTLYAFEQMQVSSYNRPSSISDVIDPVSCPNERIIGVAGHYPQDLTKWSQRLILTLGSACKILNVLGTGTATMDDSYGKPLSPLPGILRDLDRWEAALPPHLRMEVAGSLAPSSQRPLILLHAKRFYIALLVSRSALLRRATVLSENCNESLPPPVLAMSDTCIEAGKSLGRLMLNLDAIQRFNSISWWDVFYALMSALVLVLDTFCGMKQLSPESSSESQIILRELANLSARELRNPKMPSTMRKWGSILIEVNTMAERFKSTAPLLNDNSTIQSPSQESTSPASMDQHTSINQCSFPTALGTSLEGMVASPCSDDSYWQLQSWCWDDIETLLRNDAASRKT